ncbi:RHOMBOID protein [Trifolium repens]|nr:RHOMBOID protein [Trifolium repens]
MGGLYWRKVLHMHQAWRLFSYIRVHEDLTQLSTDIVTLLVVAIPLEQKFGFVRVGLLYMISGLVGSLFSSLFIQTSVTVGASGALAGLTERSLSNIVIEYWKSHLPKVVI